MLDEMLQRNASQFTIFLEYENLRSFSLNECPGLCQHRPVHSVIGEKIK